jgi:hypothetical protein
MAGCGAFVFTTFAVLAGYLLMTRYRKPYVQYLLWVTVSLVKVSVTFATAGWLIATMVGAVPEYATHFPNNALLFLSLIMNFWIAITATLFPILYWGATLFMITWPRMFFPRL